LPPSVLLIRKIFKPFRTNPSEGRVREGLLRFGPKFYPSEGRWETAKNKRRRKEKVEG